LTAAARDVDLARAAQRAADRLARLGFGLGRDAARVDDEQVGLALGDLGVPRPRAGRGGRASRPPGTPCIRGTSPRILPSVGRSCRCRHGVPPPPRSLPVRQSAEAAHRHPDRRATPSTVPFSCVVLPRAAFRRAPRGDRRTAVSSTRAAWRGERTPADGGNEALAVVRRPRGAGHRWSRRLRVGWATVTSSAVRFWRHKRHQRGCGSAAERSWAAWTRSGARPCTPMTGVQPAVSASAAQSPLTRRSRSVIPRRA
jgi:hypothetical protein